MIETIAIWDKNVGSKWSSVKLNEVFIPETFINIEANPSPTWKLNNGPAMQPVIAILANPRFAIATFPARSATELPDARIVSAK